MHNEEVDVQNEEVLELEATAAGVTAEMVEVREDHTVARVGEALEAREDHTVASRRNGGIERIITQWPALNQGFGRGVLFWRLGVVKIIRTISSDDTGLTCFHDFL